MLGLHYLLKEGFKGVCLICALREQKAVLIEQVQHHEADAERPAGPLPSANCLVPVSVSPFSSEPKITTECR